MRVLIVDNKIHDPSVKKMELYINRTFPNDKCELIDSKDFNSQEISRIDPEIVILDVALLDEEEKYFDGIEKNSIVYDPKRKLSGMKYCISLKSNFANIPVILSSNFYHGKVLSSAIEAGSDGFLYKKTITKQYLISSLKAAYYKYKTNDIALYEKLKELFDSGDESIWEQDYMRLALENFFSFGSGTRRLTGLWCQLARVIEKVLPNEIVFELLKALMDTEALLLAVNPTMRDHLRHSGNVFWLGYYILNSEAIFKTPEMLPGYSEKTYEGSKNSPFDQLNFSWILCSLLHDIGYLREKLYLVQERVDRGYQLFGEDPLNLSKIETKKSLEHISLLESYLENLNSEGQLIYNSMNKIIERWGEKNVENKRLEDHGVYSSNVFLRSLKNRNVGSLNKPEILQAASSIALHNLPKWNRDWLNSSVPVKLPIGLLPTAWLLCYCDELQGWDREPELDPFNVNNIKNLTDALSKSKSGYIQESKIKSIDFSDSTGCLLQKKLTISIQYMMVHGKSPENVSDLLKINIEKWKANMCEIFVKTLDLKNIIETQMTHLVPGPIPEEIEIDMYNR